MSAETPKTRIETHKRVGTGLFFKRYIAQLATERGLQLSKMFDSDKTEMDSPVTYHARNVTLFIVPLAGDDERFYAVAVHRDNEITTIIAVTTIRCSSRAMDELFAQFVIPVSRLCSVGPMRVVIEGSAPACAVKEAFQERGVACSFIEASGMYASREFTYELGLFVIDAGAVKISPMYCGTTDLELLKVRMSTYHDPLEYHGHTNLSPTCTCLIHACALSCIDYPD